MQYWLMKSEPSEFSINDFTITNNFSVEWFGVRNYQARNFMVREMQLGDLALFWHSSCKNPGIYGVVEISKEAHPDMTQFDPANEYFDPKATAKHPIWYCVTVKLVRKIQYISIKELRGVAGLEDMQVLKKGNRLSITGVTDKEWEIIQHLIKSV
ncbi:MAG: EVE domain-containing protein [Bacteroidia bacterium]|nr:MAG: EVE domain-containing protein [Bacteroidia bacterium]